MSDRAQLPQLSGRTFITDGGMETTLVFDDGIDLPHFASFVLLDDAAGIDALRAYYTSSRSPRSMEWGSCSIRRPGAPTTIGALGSDTRLRRSPTSIAAESLSWRNCEREPKVCRT